MNEEYKRLVRLLQEEFPVCERPFEQLAARLGTTQEHVMEMTRRLQEEELPPPPPVVEARKPLPQVPESKPATLPVLPDAE